MTEKQMMQLARGFGLDDGGLDEAVHEAASKVGSAANNGGIKAQVEFLVDQYGHIGAEKAIRDAANEE